MNDKLEKMRRTMSECIITNFSESLIIPELSDHKVVLKFFIYAAYIRNGKMIIYNIDSVFKFEDEENVNRCKIEDSNEIEITDFKEMKYMEFLDYVESYYKQLERVKDSLYKKKEDLNLEEINNVIVLHKIFDKIVSKEMKEKVYKKYFPHFINWIENI